MKRVLDALAPQAHPGWTWARRGWVACELLTWIPRGLTIPDNYSASGVLVSRSALPLTQWVVFSEPTAWAVWGLAMAALLLVAAGRVPRLGILVALTGIWALNFHEGLNFKAYDRLMFWQGVVLLLAPGGGDGARVGLPVGRYAMMLVYCGIYGSTGWMKALVEPTWGNGEVLRYALADDNFGLRPVGTLVATLPWVLAPLGWGTILFEIGFPLAIWWRRLRPPLLAGGVALHLGIFAMMHVNTFSLVAISMYPVLLDAEQWGALRRWLGGRVGRGVVLAVATPFVVGFVAPRVATAWLGPAPPAPFVLPDAGLIDALRDDAALVAGTYPRSGQAEPRRDAPLDPTVVDHVAARWEAAGWVVQRTPEPTPQRIVATRGAGPCFAAHADVQPGRRAGPDDDATGIATLLALAGRLDGGTLVAYAGALPDGVCAAPLVLDQVGRFRHGYGTQAWPGAWSWLLPWQGDFVGVVGPDAEGWRARLATRSSVPVMVLPGPGLEEWRGHGYDLPADATLLTDTGRWRGPDRAPELAYDELAALVVALAGSARDDGARAP